MEGQRSSTKPYWDTRSTSAETHLSFLLSLSLLSLPACDTYGWFSLFHFFFHSKCMLRPIAVLLRTRSDPCKAASDGWLNHDESLGSLIYMPLNSTFGSIRTKSNIYVVYWNCCFMLCFSLLTFSFTFIMEIICKWNIGLRLPEMNYIERIRKI